MFLLVCIRKKNRFIRTSTIQYQELVKYMESHSEFASSRYITKEGKVHYAQQWEELVRMLNALSNGPKKTVKQWRTISIQLSIIIREYFGL